jgi:hypothetical protein
MTCRIDVLYHKVNMKRLVSDGKIDLREIGCEDEIDGSSSLLCPLCALILVLVNLCVV